jgi:creatinine amidohydrolase
MASRGSSALDELTSVAGDLLITPLGRNAKPLAAAVGKPRSDGREVWAWSPRWKGDAHAGRIETSVMLALAPDLVQPDWAPGNTAPLAELLPRLRSEGVLGDPAGVSAEAGRELLAAAIADLAGFVEALG